MTRSEARAFIAACGGGAIARYGSRSVIYTQGGIADSILYIEQGQLKVSVFSEQGKEAIIAILKPGDLCGEDCLSGQKLRMSTATTINECTIVRLEKTRVVAALHENHALSDYFIQYLLAGNIRLNQLLIDFQLCSSEKRLARALLLLADVGREMGQEMGPEMGQEMGQEVQVKKVISNIDQETLANLIGTTRGRVNYFMNKFRRLGLVEYHGEDIRVQGSLLSVAQHDLTECR